MARMKAMKAAMQAPRTAPREIWLLEELAGELAEGVEVWAAVVGEPPMGVSGTPDGDALGSGTAVFCASNDAVGVGSPTTTEPETGRGSLRFRSSL
jgi:hypothetical protein